MLHIIIQLFTNPKAAATAAALLVGRPDIANDLHAICWRESRCQLVGAHERDAHISNREWWGQTRLGHLDPQCQPRKAPGGWATHGSWGLSAGAHWPYLPRCYQPRWLDWAPVGAHTAARKYARNCTRKRKRRGWCHVPTEVWVDNIEVSGR